MYDRSPCVLLGTMKENTTNIQYNHKSSFSCTEAPNTKPNKAPHTLNVHYIDFASVLINLILAVNYVIYH